MSTVVFDTGALTAFAGNHVLRAAVELLLDEGWDVHVPAVTLAECLTGRPRDDVVTHRTLGRFGTVVTSQSTAHYAGLMRGRLTGKRRSLPRGIDAIVAAHAALASGKTVVFTTAAPHLTALLEEHRDVAVCRVP
jgi:predicted nucleic acid-binding protein